MKKLSHISDVLKISNKKIIVGISLGILSGIMSFLFLTFLNYCIANLLNGTYKVFDHLYLIIFLLIIVLFIWARRALSLHIIELSQSLFWQLRLEVLQMVMKSDYGQMKRKRDEIHSVLTFDIGALTQASLSIIEFMTAMVMVITCLVYMFFTSHLLFFLTLGTCVLGIGLYQWGARKNNKRFHESRTLEDNFSRHFIAILDGYKEIYMNRLKGKAIMTRKVIPITNEALHKNTEAYVGFLNNQIIGQILFYILISCILLVVSVMSGIPSLTTVTFLFILLYLLGSVETMMVLLPVLFRAKISFNRLVELKTTLESIDEDDSYLKLDDSAVVFQSIQLKQICYKYDSEQTVKAAFEIGPIDLPVNKSDVIFIYGGNGSGKTTAIHVLLGLLKPQSGEIVFNGQPLTTGNQYSDYRKVFSVVLSDFYLFDELYGNENFDRQLAEEYLTLFEIDKKVQITNTGFSVIELSTGQRKRLALIAALLEERPVLVLDEWAADQDPYFRKKFYTIIIPHLKQRGITIIAITHDDHYYHCADKCYKMEDGLLTEAIYMKSTDRITHA